MFCDPLDLPDEIVSAQEEGQLVIFAGAGVSMGSPAKLPGFKKLAERIAHNTSHTVRKPYDEFLGDMANAGIQVHRLCREIIADPNSTHTAIHSDLARLFRRQERVRIVTTNFDLHFTGAVKDLGWDVPVYQAPALPLGHDFQGIVHLHGSIRDEPRRLVLTDADFGHAYLTDAWASVFLRAMFAEFTVLFVGYSHDDPPMRYLARGLAGRRGHQRFALTSDAELAKWRPLGITPISYPIQAMPDEHELLNKGVHRWVEITELQPLEIEARLRDILSGPEDIAPNRSETDFVRRCLMKDETAQYFVRYAQSWRWVEWLHSERLIAKYLRTSYARSTQQTDEERSYQTAERRIAGWLGVHLARDNRGRGLWLVHKYGGVLGEVVSASVGGQLATDAGIDLANHGIAAWIVLLIQGPGPPHRANMLGQLLVRLAKKKLWPAALRLFAYACRPQAIVEESFAFSDQPENRTADLRIRIAQGSVYLPQVWKDCFNPALPQLAEELLNLFDEIVRDAHRLSSLLGQGNAHSSAVLHTRSYIQAHSAYIGESDLAHIITWFCEVVSFLAKATPGLAPMRIGDWLRADDPVLYRISLYALAQTVRMTAAEKLDWILRYEFLFRPVIGARHEMYALLKEIYRDLNEAERSALWQTIEAGPPKDWLSHVEDKEELAARRQNHIDRIVWVMHQAYPEDAQAKVAFGRLQTRAPKFATANHEHIDLDFWSSGVKDANTSPKSPDELLKTDPATQLDYLLTYQGSNPFERTREGLVSAAAAAAGQDTVWGMNLLRSLAAREQWESDLWPSVLWRINFLVLAMDDQQWILATLIAPLSQRPEALNGLSHFLFAATLLSNECPLDPGVIAALVEVSMLLWTKIRTDSTEEDVAKLSTTNWHELAINRPAGRIVEFWLRFTEHHRAATEKPPEGWPATLTPGFNQITSAAAPADWQGLAILGRDLAFARFVAPEWTRKQLYPLLDFRSVGDKAWPLFHAFIFYGTLNRDLLLELPPYFLKATEPFAKANDDERGRAFLAIVGLIVYSGLWEVTTSGWLRDILLVVSDQQRTDFATSLGQALRDVAPDSMATFWKRWMREYWHERLKGRPLPLSAAENGAMVAWAWRLPPTEFAEAGQLLRQGPKPSLRDWVPLESMLKTRFPAEAPVALLDLWHWTLEACQSYYEDKDEYLKFLAMLPRDPQLLPKWELICQQLSRHGITWAPVLLFDGQKHFSQSPPSTPSAANDGEGSANAVIQAF